MKSQNEISRMINWRDFQKEQPETNRDILVYDTDGLMTLTKASPFILNVLKKSDLGEYWVYLEELNLPGERR